ncbi:DUF1963 domain-containing protein [Streptomyces sp. NPDC002143]
MNQGPHHALHILAHDHFPAGLAERWTGLLCTGLHLAPALQTDTVIGRLGGLPALPHDIEWPVREGHGPMSHIASIDGAALPADELDIRLPRDGTLAFFYFDGQDGDVDTCIAAA